MFYWSPERVALLKALWMEGQSATQIGESWYVTRNVIMGKVSRLKMPKRAQDTGNSNTVITKRKSRSTPFRPKPVPPPPDPNVDLPPNQSQFAVTFMQLKHHHCRWPIDVPDGPIMYCGANHVEGFPYCSRHCREAYPKPGRTA